jgi:cysteine desulfurase / selenocysteine lyase
VTRATFDVAAVRRQIPILAGPPDGRPLHYLDNGATSQLPQPVLDALIEHETTRRANVLRGVHRLAEAATAAYEEARAEIGRYVGAGAPEEIVFTSGTTGAINLVAHSLGQSFKAGDEIVLSRLEHHSNIVPWQLLRDRAGVVLKALPATDDGRIDTDALATTVTKRTRLIAVTHVSNVTGAVTDVARIVEAARAAGARVLLDGAQGAPHGPFDVQALGVDFYAFSGHKMFAPNGVGVLWGKAAALDALPPFLGGGEMIRRVTLERTEYAAVPQRFEAGTPPIAQAVALAAAARWVKGLDPEALHAHLMRLTGRLLDGLGERRHVRIVGPRGLQARFPVVSFHVEGVHPHDICQIADEHGVALRGGHHCAQPFMDALDLPGTTRASLAPYNDDGDVDAFFRGLDDALERLA